MRLHEFWTGPVEALGVLSLAFSLNAAGADVPGKTGWPAGYLAAHTVVICPYLDPTLSAARIPECDGVPATCMGSDGHDLIIGSSGDDVIVGLAGNDVIHGDEGRDLICGGPGNDAIHGAKGDDRLFGGEGNDNLFGARGDDLLFGGPGDFDVLWGGPGYDRLDGGPGAYDLCMLQRQLGEVEAATCGTLYPPPGYVHDEEPDPGILNALEPGGR